MSSETLLGASSSLSRCRSSASRRKRSVVVYILIKLNVDSNLARFFFPFAGGVDRDSHEASWLKPRLARRTRGIYQLRNVQLACVALVKRNYTLHIANGLIDHTLCFAQSSQTPVARLPRDEHFNCSLRNYMCNVLFSIFFFFFFI